MAVYNKGFPRLSLPVCVRDNSCSLVEIEKVFNLLDKEILSWVGSRLS